jgi:hypothetical protein
MEGGERLAIRWSTVHLPISEAEVYRWIEL